MRKRNDFITTSDTELIPHLLVTNLNGLPSSWNTEEITKLIDENISPSYSLLLLKIKLLHLEIDLAIGH